MKCVNTRSLYLGLFYYLEYSYPVIIKRVDLLGEHTQGFALYAVNGEKSQH